MRTILSTLPLALTVICACAASLHAAETPPSRALGEMFEAIQAGDPARVAVILKTDPTVVRQVGPLGSTPLRGRTNTLAALLVAGADPEARDIGNQTPLHLAAFTGGFDAARLLRAHGARSDARDANGQTPLDHARLRRHFAVLQLLEGKLDPTPTPQPKDTK